MINETHGTIVKIFKYRANGKHNASTETGLVIQPNDLNECTTLDALAGRYY